MADMVPNPAINSQNEMPDTYIPSNYADFSQYIKTRQKCDHQSILIIQKQDLNSFETL